MSGPHDQDTREPSGSGQETGAPRGITSFQSVCPPPSKAACPGAPWERVVNWGGEQFPFSLSCPVRPRPAPTPTQLLQAARASSLLAAERLKRFRDPTVFKQAWLLWALPAVTNSKEKRGLSGGGGKKLLEPAGFRQAGSGGNKRKPLTNHSVILILWEKRAGDA